MHFSSTLAATALLGVAVMAVPTASKAKTGQIVAIHDQANWCMMMPPEEGGLIAPNEDRAIAFCTHPNMADAPGAKTFPQGFIQSAHFATGNGWVQVTGKIDRSKYKLNPKDEGGQFDIKAPVGSWCANYNHYVNLVEPSTNEYCIRCCKDKKDCNTGKSTYGCHSIIPGDYSGPNVPVDTAAPSAVVPTAPVPSSPVKPTGAVPGSPSSVGPTATSTPVVSTAAIANTTATTTATGTSSPTPSNAASGRKYPSAFGVVAAAAVALLAL